MQLYILSKISIFFFYRPQANCPSTAVLFQCELLPFCKGSGWKGDTCL